MHKARSFHRFKVKLKLSEIQMEKARLTILNTQAKWFNEGEQSTKYFLNLQKQRNNEKNMSKIFMDDGTVTTERSQILKETKRFYENLYTADTNVCFTLTNNGNRCLSDDERDQIDTLLSLADLTYALNTMAHGKSPGIDGIPSEFYSTFWDILGEQLLRAFLYSKSTGQLFTSVRRGALALLPKKGRDLMHVKNWRPIALLNTDYKILAKCLANRIKLFLDKLIAVDQTGFMQGQNISSNIRKLIDKWQFCEDNNVDACILIADFEKCFDSIEYSSVDRVMAYFNFGTQMRQWIKLLFTNFSLCILSNGYTSEYFPAS